MLLRSAQNVPKLDLFSESDPFVVVELVTKDGARLASARSATVHDCRNPVWNQILTLQVDQPHEKQRRVGAADTSTGGVVVGSASDVTVRLTLYDKGEILGSLLDEGIGECCTPLMDLMRGGFCTLLVCSRDGNAVLGTEVPHWPCQISLALLPETLPAAWRESLMAESLQPLLQPSSSVDSTAANASYPRHIFMMTRGTRGDVQPFIALARGMAEQRGWQVTICTELCWKSFVESNARVSNGRILFRPSGGDTERRVDTALARWAMRQKTEVMQMLMLSKSEAEFLPSATVIIHHIQDLQKQGTIDLLVYGFTLVGIAVLASEVCGVPLSGFFLQPSCVPSTDPNWTAVQNIDSHLSLIETLEKAAFTGHETLRVLKDFAEKNPFSRWNIKHIRRWFLLPNINTWEVLRMGDSPIVIPMKEDTFKRPDDWWPALELTNFIFLRNGGGSHGSSLGEALTSFIVAARNAGAKLGLMTFSSMPADPATVLQCSARMVEECPYALRLIYVGKRQAGTVSRDLSARIQALSQQSRFLEVERADFGLLFREMDVFIVHGGLGTTVEALRMRKPTCVTGPLLLDQRFWGAVCADKGVGPPPVHIDNFEECCVKFVNGALDPADPHGWQRRAAEQDWGHELEDGVAANVDAFARLLDSGSLSPVQTGVPFARQRFLWRGRSPIRKPAALKWLAALGVLAIAMMLGYALRSNRSNHGGPP